MRHPCFLLLALALAAGSLRAADSPFAWEQASLHVAAQPGQRIVTVAFPFQNRRGSAVTILGLETSCRCLSATAPKMTYAAGEKGIIEVAMAVGNQRGALEKTVTVTTDDRDGLTTELTLYVDVPVPN